MFKVSLNGFKHQNSPKEVKHSVWNIPGHLLHLAVWYGKSRSALWQNSQINPFAWQSYNSKRDEFKSKKNIIWEWQQGYILTVAAVRTLKALFFPYLTAIYMRGGALQNIFKKGQYLPSFDLHQIIQWEEMQLLCQMTGDLFKFFQYTAKRNKTQSKLQKIVFQEYFQNKPLLLL